MDWYFEKSNKNKKYFNFQFKKRKNLSEINIISVYHTDVFESNVRNYFNENFVEGFQINFIGECVKANDYLLENKVGKSKLERIEKELHALNFDFNNKQQGILNFKNYLENTEKDECMHCLFARFLSMPKKHFFPLTHYGIFNYRNEK